MTDDRFDELVGTALMSFVLVVGVVFFLSGFRFINPLDTAFRLFSGGIATLGAAAYLWQHRRRSGWVARMAARMQEREVGRTEGWWQHHQLIERPKK